MKSVDLILDSFCERIKEIRDEKNWTIKQFAEFVQIPRTTINSWILKKRMPQIDLIYKIADSFNVSIDFLVGRED